MAGLWNWLPFTSYDLPRLETDCPLCGSSDKEPLASLDRRLRRLDHVKCGQCGLVRQHGLPTPDALKDYYSRHYRSDYQGQAAAPTQRHIAKRQREAERRLLHLRDRIPNNATVIDCGCGSGEFVELLGRAGFRASGFEPGHGYASYARATKGLDVTCASFDDFQARTKAHAVTSFHVFEHLTDPRAAFARLVSFANDDGVIYLEVPNLENALRKGFGCLHLAHTIGFTRATLELLGALFGYAVDHTDDEYDIGMIFRRGTPRTLDAIMADGRESMSQWNRASVHRQFWRYSVGKVVSRPTP